MKKFAIIFILLPIIIFSSCAKTYSDDDTTSPFAEEVLPSYEYVTGITEPDDAPSATEHHNETTETASGTLTTNQESADTTEKRTPETTQETTEEHQETKTTKPAETVPMKQADAVTISITCGEILDNMDKLKKGKEYFVPSDGVILGETSVEIKDGDTVFDVLKSVCERNGIQLEFAYSGVFGSYYIEGINQLYEKDCGFMSGWIYIVNGEYPSVGSSVYKLKNGDNIMFIYNCESE